MPLPDTHSARHAPLAVPALQTGITALRGAVFEQLPPPARRAEPVTFRDHTPGIYRRGREESGARVA